jgi:hypothetical protein
MHYIVFDMIFEFRSCIGGNFGHVILTTLGLTELICVWKTGPTVLNEVNIVQY